LVFFPRFGILFSKQSGNPDYNFAGIFGFKREEEEQQHNIERNWMDDGI
jgi:hypothetical protein